MGDLSRSSLKSASEELQNDISFLWQVLRLSSQEHDTYRQKYVNKFLIA